MKSRTFPGTDVTVSEIGFGVWTVASGWWPETQSSGQAGHHLLREALDLGITFFDTADVYGDGAGESIVREALGDRRDAIQIGTKGGYDFVNHPARKGQRERPQDFSPEYITSAVEASLERLGTDRIDIYQLHNVQLDQVLADDLFATLDRLVEAGKLRAYGTALGPAIGWLHEGREAIRRGRGVGMQMIYNCLEQEPGRQLFAAATEQPMGFLVRVPHSSGMLEGHYTAETVFPEGDHRRHRPRYWLLNGLEKIRRLTFLTEDGASLGQAALQFVLAEPTVVSVLPNIYGSDQLREFAAASDLPPLSLDQVARVQALYDTNYGIDEPPMKYKGLTADEVAVRLMVQA